MTTLYKGINLNDPGDPAPWSPQEVSNFREIIDSLAIDTVSGTLADAKTIGHHHDKLYSASANILTLSIDSGQKVTMAGALKIATTVQIDSMTTPGFLVNDGAGNITGDNASTDLDTQEKIQAGVYSGWIKIPTIAVNADPTKFDILTEGISIHVDKSTTPFTTVKQTLSVQAGIAGAP